ncbi:hypothetical protein GCM10020256_38820 [Streptomyces thermocoprophilus]
MRARLREEAGGPGARAGLTGRRHGPRPGRRLRDGRTHGPPGPDTRLHERRTHSPRPGHPPARTPDPQPPAVHTLHNRLSHSPSP